MSFFSFHFLPTRYSCVLQKLLISYFIAVARIKCSFKHILLVFAFVVSRRLEASHHKNAWHPVLLSRCHTYPELGAVRPHELSEMSSRHAEFSSIEIVSTYLVIPKWSQREKIVTREVRYIGEQLLGKKMACQRTTMNENSSPGVLCLKDS